MENAGSVGCVDLAEGDLLGRELAVVDPEHEEVRHLRAPADTHDYTPTNDQTCHAKKRSRRVERRSGGPSENPAHTTNPRAQRQRYIGSISTLLMIHSRCYTADATQLMLHS